MKKLMVLLMSCLKISFYLCGRKYSLRTFPSSGLTVSRPKIDWEGPHGRGIEWHPYIRYAAGGPRGEEGIRWFYRREKEGQRSSWCTGYIRDVFNEENASVHSFDESDSDQGYNGEDENEDN